MKLFKIDFSDSPSERESTILIAESKEDALGMIDIDDHVETSEEPKSRFQLHYSKWEYRIEEVQMIKGVVYTGHYCC